MGTYTFNKTNGYFSDLKKMYACIDFIQAYIVRCEFDQNLSNCIIETNINLSTEDQSTLSDNIDNLNSLNDIDYKSRTNGFADYNNNIGSVIINKNIWTDINNNGQGQYTNKNYIPDNITDLLDTSNGYIKTDELDLGDAILVRTDFNITPTNNSNIHFRFELGSGLGIYHLTKSLSVSEFMSGVLYPLQFSEYIYMGDNNTKNSPIKMQIYSTEEITLENKGSVIQVFRNSF